MLWFKKKKADAPKVEAPIETPAEMAPKKGFFQSLKNGLTKTRERFTKTLQVSILGKKIIDPELLEEIETELLVADVGVTATEEILADVKNKIDFHNLENPTALWEVLNTSLTNILTPCEVPLQIPRDKKPFVILMIGVNGTGKTTTIGKLAHKFKNENKSVLLAAGDTFRAAAVEQLQAWGKRLDVGVVSQATGADSAAVIFDAYHSAKAKGIDVLIADTAGRLHTQKNLMQELQKVKKVLTKIDPELPHEVMLVLDGTIGQNALVQALEFNNAMQVTGLTITKLDGTAKAGIIFAIAKKLNLPIRYIGVGEQLDNLEVFNAKDFVSALLEH